MDLNSGLSELRTLKRNAEETHDEIKEAEEALTAKRALLEGLVKAFSAKRSEIAKAEIVRRGVVFCTITEHWLAAEVLTVWAVQDDGLCNIHQVCGSCVHRLLAGAEERRKDTNPLIARTYGVRQVEQRNGDYYDLRTGKIIERAFGPLPDAESGTAIDAFAKDLKLPNKLSTYEIEGKTELR